MLYFDLSFWHSFCFERWTRTPKLRLKNFQLSLEHDESECEFLKYMESISIINNRILWHLRVKRKVVRAYKNIANAERCPVELNKK